MTAKSMSGEFRVAVSVSVPGVMLTDSLSLCHLLTGTQNGATFNVVISNNCDFHTEHNVANRPCEVTLQMSSFSKLVVCVLENFAMRLRKGLEMMSVCIFPLVHLFQSFIH